MIAVIDEKKEVLATFQDAETFKREMRPGFEAPTKNINLWHRENSQWVPRKDISISSGPFYFHVYGENNTTTPIKAGEGTFSYQMTLIKARSWEQIKMFHDRIENYPLQLFPEGGRIWQVEHPEKRVTHQWPMLRHYKW